MSYTYLHGVSLGYQEEVGVQAELPGSHSSGSGVVGPHPSQRDDAVTPLGDGLSETKVKLTNLTGCNYT